MGWPGYPQIIHLTTFYNLENLLSPTNTTSSHATLLLINYYHQYHHRKNHYSTQTIIPSLFIPWLVGVATQPGGLAVNTARLLFGDGPQRVLGLFLFLHISTEHQLECFVSINTHIFYKVLRFVPSLQLFNLSQHVY